MTYLILLIVFIAPRCCCFDLKGSVHHLLHTDDHYNHKKHKPLPMFHPQDEVLGQEIPSHYVTQLEDITATKTIVLETTKSVHSHMSCVKAYPGLPPCLVDSKILSPTPVYKTPIHEATKELGHLNNKGKCELHLSPHQRKGRKIFNFRRALRPAKYFFRKTLTVTETVWVTRVEHYVENLVTATLVAENCIPYNDDIPPCPAKVEHYVHHYNAPGRDHIPIYEKETAERRIDTNENYNQSATEITNKPLP